MRRFSILAATLLILLCYCSVEVCSADQGGLSRSMEQRILGRSFPSVFQAWSPAEVGGSTDPLAVAARHDLIWHGVGWYGLRWDAAVSGLGEKLVAASIANGLAQREKLLKLNPNVILIAEIRYRDASRRFLPENHKWWARDEAGKIVKGWGEGGFLCLDFANADYRRHVAQRAKAVVESGVVDGVLLDWWRDDEDRLALVKEVRKAIGGEHLIIANANDRKTPLTAAYINGYFMECYRSKTAQDWRRIESTLLWAQEKLRRPAVNCLEVWFHNSRRDLNLMRATTTLSLTHSNGYCLFSDPNPLPTPDHRHDWYPFWDKRLGKPVSERKQRADGAFSREFEDGTVVYNPMGNSPALISFKETRKSLATGKSARRHTVAALDGDIFLR